MKLDVYEVSYCATGGVCGPGFDGQSGIHSFLYFDFQGGPTKLFQQRFGAKFPVFRDKFLVPYNPPLWMFAQFGK